MPPEKALFSLVANYIVIYIHDELNGKIIGA